MPKLKFADDLPQPASVNAPLQCQICFESPAETAAEATPEEPSLFAECDNTNERDQQAAPQQQAHCPPAKTALSDHGRQRYSLEKKREALELFNRGYGYKRASIVLGVRLIPYATGTASIRRIDSCRAAALWTRNRSGKKQPMKADGASA
ncbi:hypothetical protein [Sutterella wadsworthensis]|uniref:hypothetical protein n=2 Tax=Sutterella wadsworthensis TaxID=40545 RepID=UPI00307EC383